MDDGYGAPFISAFYKGVQIQERIESFKYSSSEDDDDDCEINIRLDDRTAPDNPMFQEGVQWTVIWGYIGGQKSHVRKVFAYELKWEFDDQNILLTISFHDKAVSTKQRDSKEVHINTSIIDILHKTGKTHGLKTSVEIPGVNGAPPIKILTTDELQKSLKDFSEQQRLKQEKETKLFGSTNASLIDNPSGGFSGIQIETQGSGLNFTVGLTGFGSVSHNIGINIPGQTNITGIDQELVFRQLIQNFDMYASVAQGNKTDKQLLDELGKRQPGGQFILDTTDDEATLKKRNFNQKPIRSWTWANGTGELQAFQPESKGKSKDGTSINMNYDGWDKINKTYFNGDVNVKASADLDEEGQKTLAKFQKQLTDLKFADDKKVLGYTAVTHEASIRADATNRVQIIPIAHTILDKKNALQNTIDYFTGGGNNKSVNDPTSNDPTKTGNFASNLRDEAELKMNPGYIEAVGDPNVMKGKIITILGVSKKYSGNYYITKVEHTMGDKKAYMMHIDIVRQGVNIKPNDKYVSNKETGKELNKTIAPPQQVQKTQPVTITVIPADSPALRSNGSNTGITLFDNELDALEGNRTLPSPIIPDPRH